MDDFIDTWFPRLLGVAGMLVSVLAIILLIWLIVGLCTGTIDLSTNACVVCQK